MAKKRGATKKGSAGAGDVSTAIDLLLSVPEISESFSRADLELALDDRGWIQSAVGLSGGNDLDPVSRTSIVRRARMYWQRDPLAKQAVRLWTDYALGRGLTWKAKSPATQTKLNKTWKSHRNRGLFSQRGQVKTSKKLLIDGDVFIAIFDDGESKTFRRLDAMQVADFVADPDDAEHILAYRRQLPDGKTSLWYADWRCTDEDKALAEKQKSGPRGERVKLEVDVVVYHQPFDDIGERGNSLLACSLDWSREHRRFQESRVALTQALAKFAHKITAKGGQKVLDDLGKRLSSSMATNGLTPERNPKTAAGGTWLQNAGMELDQMPRTTGAGDARSDANNLKLMVSAGTGIMLHYFGDPENGNLATTTAMELPMLKMFGSYQQLLQDMYRDLASITLDEDPDAEPEEIDINLPPILEPDVQALGTAVSTFTTAFPELKVDVILQRILEALGINNIDDVMKDIKLKQVEVQKQQDAEAKAAQRLAAAAGGGPRRPAPVMAKESAEQLAAAITALSEALSE